MGPLVKPKVHECGPNQSGKFADLCFLAGKVNAIPAPDTAYLTDAMMTTKKPSDKDGHRRIFLHLGRLLHDCNEAF